MAKRAAGGDAMCGESQARYWRSRMDPRSLTATAVPVPRRVAVGIAVAAAFAVSASASAGAAADGSAWTRSAQTLRGSAWTAGAHLDPGLHAVGSAAQHV